MATIVTVVNNAASTIQLKPANKTSASISVAPSSNISLGQLIDVDVSNATNGQGLIYSSANGKFENGTLYFPNSTFTLTGGLATANTISAITVDVYGRITAATGAAIAINTAQITSGTLADARLPDTGTAGTYANVAYVPVITTDSKGRVTAITNTAIAIDTSQITSGTVADARLPTKGTAGTYANASYIPVITTDAYGRVTAITNTAIAISSGVVTGVMTFAQGGANAISYTTGGLLTSNGTSFVSVANTGTAGTYANAAYIPVITTDAYGRVSAVTNTAVAIDTSQLTSGTVADARLPATGTAGTYANSTYIPVITTDTYGRVTAITNTVIQSSTTSVQGIVQLTDSISSTSTTTAATPNSVKTAYDLATTANTNAVNAGTYANAAFAKANSANVIAQAAFDNSNTKFNSSGGSISGDTTVTGNLTIIGQTIYANTTTALIADNIITLNAAIGQASSPTVNAGIEVDRGSSANVLLQWNETTDKWQFTNDGSTFYDIADAGRLDSVFSLANGTAGVANTDFTTISASAGVYGNTAYLPVVTLTANGRVSSITNTAIAIDTAAITSGTLADDRLPATGTAGTYANASHVPVITTDSKGRVTAVTNTTIAISASQISGGTISGDLVVTGNITGGNVVTVGIVSATGNVSGNYFIGNGSALTGISAGGGSTAAAVGYSLIFGG